MNFKVVKNCVWIQNFMILLFLCLTDTSHSQLSSSHVQNSVEPANIFFYDIFSKETILSQSPQQKKKDMTCHSLGVDESCILIHSNVDFPVKFQHQSMECENCTLLNYNILEPKKSQDITLKLVSLGTIWQVSDERNISVCNKSSEYLGENSWYHLYINANNCSLINFKEPENIYIPIYIALGVYILFALMWSICCFSKRTEIFKCLFKPDSLDDLAAAYSSSTTIEEKKPKASTQRLRSLDTVRGISIVVMIFVNYGGGKYQFFDHSIWNGLTVADLVFPWFIWMMGMSMALSLRSQLRKVVSRKKIFYKIVKRSMILFALGIMLNTACTLVNLENLRILGVLQRFSISYFIVATVHLFYASANDETNPSSEFRDITPYSGEWLIMLTFLALHLLLSFLVHAPDCPRGYFGPGGLHNQGAHADCTGGAAGYIDRILLGMTHLYQRPSIKAIYYNSLPYDPEGILGYFTSIFLVFLGLQAGKILLTYKESKARIIRWVAWGLILGLISGILCKFSKNDGWIPVNKNLWSVSFILATGSFAFILLSICYYLCDVQKWWSGGPFYQAGMNSIVLYVGHSMTHNMFPFSWQIGSTHMKLLFMNLWGATVWVIIAVWMYYKNIFISV